MTTGGRSATSGSTLHRVRTHVLFPLVVFALPQGLSAAVIAMYAHGDYTGFTSRWDGQEFLSIARAGYPVDPARGADGEVTDGRWAFYPLFPLLLRGATELTRLPLDALAPILNLAAGAVTTVLLYRVSRRLLGTPVARGVVILFATFMAAPVFQLAYSEALGMMLLMAVVVALADRRHVWVLALLLLLALTRPLAAPVAATFAIDAVVQRLRGERSRTRWSLACAAAAAVLALLWPAYAAIRTGETTIYLDTENAYVRSGVARSWLTWAVDLGVAGVVVLLAVLGVQAWAAFRLMPAGVPTWWRSWLVVYPAYILAGTYVSGATVRLLLPTFSAAALLAPLADHRRGRLLLLGVAILGVALQVVWIVVFVGRDRGLVP